MSYPPLKMKKGGFKISPACKAAAKRKFDVYPSAYANAWGVRCTKAGGPGSMGKSKKAQRGAFELPKSEQDRLDAEVIKGTRTKRQARMDRRAEKETDRIMRRSQRKVGRKKYGDKNALEIYQEKLRKKANRKKGKRKNAFGPKRVNRRGRPTGGKGNAGCQGAGCGAYE